MEQKVIATVGGHQITEAEVEAFIQQPSERTAGICFTSRIFVNSVKNS